MILVPKDQKLEIKNAETNNPLKWPLLVKGWTIRPELMLLEHYISSQSSYPKITAGSTLISPS